MHSLLVGSYIIKGNINYMYTQIHIYKYIYIEEIEHGNVFLYKVVIFINIYIERYMYSLHIYKRE